MSSRNIEFGTSFYTKKILSMRCSIISIQNENAVRIEIEPNDIAEKETQGANRGKSYSLIINGRDEDRVTKAFISIVNLFPKEFKSENNDMFFPETITTFDEILDHPRSFGMSFHWTKSP